MSQVAPHWLGEASSEWVRDYLAPPPKERSKLFADALQRVGRDGMLAYAEGVVLGVERLAWDSQHFGFPCARVTPLCISPRLSLAERRAALETVIDEAVAWCRAQGIRFISRRMVAARANEAALFESSGFRLVDVMLTFTASPIEATAACVRPFTEQDAPELRRIARDSFPDSRFVSDTRFDPEKGADVYTKWLEGYVDGAMAQGGGTILVAHDSGEVAGFIGMRQDASLDAIVNERVVLIELFAVARARRGRRYGAQLLTAAKAWACSRGASLLEASTWASAAAAIGSYRSAGFEMRETLLTFHCHLA